MAAFCGAAIRASFDRASAAAIWPTVADILSRSAAADRTATTAVWAGFRRRSIVPSAGRARAKMSEAPSKNAGFLGFSVYATLLARRAI